MSTNMWHSIVARLRADDGPANIMAIVDELVCEFRDRYPDAPSAAPIGAAYALLGRALLAVAESDPDPDLAAEHTDAVTLH
jgi:hypothetical protein